MDREEKATRKAPRRKAGKRKEKRREGAEGTGAPQSKFYEKTQEDRRRTQRRKMIIGARLLGKTWKTSLLQLMTKNNIIEYRNNYKKRLI